ncbi:MAG: ComF family protein [Chthoniobacterales bacterium]
MTRFRPWQTALSGLFFPPHCAVCERALSAGALICAGCAAGVRRVELPRCGVCSHPFDGVAGEMECSNCRGHEFYFDTAVSVMRCVGSVRDLLHRFKYGRERYLRRILGEWLAEALDDPRLADVKPDVLVPVPLHPARLRERQFNQAFELSEWVTRLRGVPTRQVLGRKRYTTTQTRFDRERRMQNLRDAFVLRQNADVTNNHILLVDDILTTGSTLDECGRVLLEAGAASVNAITVARG